MDCLPITDEGLDRAFTTALLLTASAVLAEAAVLIGIGAMGRCDYSDEALLGEAMAASTQAQLPEERFDERAQASSLLPLELRRVLRLPRDLRRCLSCVSSSACHARLARGCCTSESSG